MHTTTTTLKQSIMPSLKHPNCGKISGYNGTLMTLSSILLETLMAVYGRLDHRDTEYGLRAPEITADKQYMKYYFLLPRGAKIQSVKTFSYKPVKVTNGPNGEENTFVVSEHGDSKQLYHDHGIDENLSELAGRDVSVYFISVHVDIYKINDFFPYVIRWKAPGGNNAPEFNSCLCFYNILEKQGNMSNFAAKYLTYLAQECIGCYKVVTPATTSFDDGAFKMKNPLLQKFVYEKPGRTGVYSRKDGQNKQLKQYEFKDLDHLMLPSVRFNNDVLYVMSMNDFTTLGTYTKYLAASLVHFIKTFEAEKDHNEKKKEKLFGFTNDFFTIDYQEGMGVKPVNATFETEKIPLVMVGSKIKGNPAQSVDNEIYLHCKSSTFNRMIFGAIPNWHSRTNATLVTYSSYGNGCLSKFFIDQIYSEIDANIWRDLTTTDFKDSIFSTIVGYTSNEIDDRLFGDSKLVRSMAANNSSYADALIYYYSKENPNITHGDYEEIRNSVATIYKMAFKEFIEFLHSASNLDQFTNPPDIGSGPSYEPFVRINQAPHKIHSLVMIAPSKTRIGNESHDVHTVKLSYTVVTGQHLNSKLFNLVDEKEKDTRVRVHNRADGGIFMAIDSNGGTESKDIQLILSSPFGKAARDAYRISEMFDSHVDFFIPSVINVSKAIPATIVGTQPKRQVNIVEISHRYPESIEGAKINPRYYQQKRSINGNYEENSEIFSAISPPTYGERSRNTNESANESFKASDVKTIKSMWESYVCMVEFLKIIINHADCFIPLHQDAQGKVLKYALSTEFLIACIIVNSTKGNNNMYDFMEHHEVEEKPTNLLTSVKAFLAIEDISPNKEIVLSIRDKLKGESDEKKHNAIVGTELTLEKLNTLYGTMFPMIYKNFCANSCSSFHIHRLNMITKAIMNFKINSTKLDTEYLSHLTLINAALLMCDYSDKSASTRTSYYKREQYMGMSASAYLKKHPEKNAIITIQQLLEHVRDNLRYDDNGKKISMNPVFANIANVPMMKRGLKTYVHLLNDMCSVNSVSMYYFIKSLCDFKNENFRFDFILGFVKRDMVANTQRSTGGVRENEDIDNKDFFKKVVDKIEKKGEEFEFKDFSSFMKSVNGAMSDSDRGKHRAATKYILARFAHDRSFANGILPSTEPRYQVMPDNRVENLHAEFRTFYQRGGRMTKEALVEREKNRIEEYLNGTA